MTSIRRRKGKVKKAVHLLQGESGEIILVMDYDKQLLRHVPAKITARES